MPESSISAGPPHLTTREPVSTEADGSRHLAWLVASFTAKVAGVTATLVVTADGLPLAASEALDDDAADQLAAVTSGLSSLTQGAARCLDGGGVRQVLVEMDRGFLLVVAVGDGSVLAVLADSRADLGLVAYEMALLVTRVGPLMCPGPRRPMSVRPR